MRKAAENERIKLRANFLNNISVALTFTGVLIPMFSLYKEENFDFLADWTGGRTQLTSIQGTQMLLTVVAFCLAVWAAVSCHSAAIKEIGKLQD